MSKTNDEIEKMIRIQESIKKRRLSEKEIRKIEKKIRRIDKLEKAFRGFLVALGFGMGVAGTKFLTEGKGDKVTITSEMNNNESLSEDKEKEKFLQGLKYTGSKEEEEQIKQEGVKYSELKKDFGYIVRKYNEIYGTNLGIEDFGILGSNPELLTKTYNEQGDTIYIQDIDDYNGISEDRELVEGDEFGNTTKVIINRNTKETVFGVAVINGEIQPLEVKQARNSENTVYKENPINGNINTVIFENMTDKEKKEIYDSIQERYKEIVSEQYSKTNNDDYYEEH